MSSSTKPTYEEYIRTSFKDFLPANQVERFVSFSHSEAGWGGRGHYRPLSRESLDGCLLYLRIMQELGHKFWEDAPLNEHKVSTFMNAMGQVELNWYDENWALHHITFTNGSECEVFISAPNKPDQEYIARIDAKHVPFYTLTSSTRLLSKEEAASRL